MDSLRRPIFFLALALIAIVVLTELGAALIPLNTGTGPGSSALSGELREEFDDLDDEQKAELSALGSGDAPPGLGILYMALLDGVVLFSVALMGVSLLIPEGVHGRLQGCVTLVFMLFLILGAILLCFLAFQLVILMVSLLLSFPFGTIVYMVVFGHFDRGAAAVILALLMLLKLGFAGSLVVAHQRFLENRGLILLILTSLLANIILSFLHGFVPGFMVSITDGIGAIIVAVLAIIWALLLLIGAVIGVVRALIP